MTMEFGIQQAIDGFKSIVINRISTIEEKANGVDQMAKDTKEALEEMRIKQREFADEILEIQQKGTAPADGSHNDCGTPGSRDSMGAKVWKEIRAPGNADLMTKVDKIGFEIKAAGDPLTTAVARTVQSAGVGSPGPMALGVHNAFPVRYIGATSAIEYSRYTGLEGAAALQSAEGAAKAAVRPTFTLVSQGALTIAGYSKISKQALNDQQELQRAIDVTLRRSIATALDSELNSGAWGGLLTLATAYTSLVYDGLADAASEAVATMQEAGFVPDTVVMRPADWLAITTAKATGSGEYLSGAYLAPLPELLRGMKVVLSPTVTAGKGLVVDTSQIELLVVEDLNVEIGTDADDFTKNVRTILGELRVVPTFRAVGAARLITPA
jgi:hypothetical protein